MRTDFRYLESDLHDQGVANISLDEETLRFDAERYNDDSKTYEPVSIVFYGVSDFKIDNVSASSVKPVYDDGEIIHFEIINKSILLIIQWDDFKNKRKSTSTYRFNFENMEVHDERA